MYWNICNKYRKFKKTKSLNISIVYSKCGHEYKKNI